MSAAQDFPRIPLDMDAIASQAQAPTLRRWLIEFMCNGKPYDWQGEAKNIGQADTIARAELSHLFPFFRPADARMVTCVELRS